MEWAPIAESSQQWAKKARDFEFLDIDRPRIDFAKIAIGFNVVSYRIESTKELDSALTDAIRTAQSNKPVLLDIILDKYTGKRSSVVP